MYNSQKEREGVTGGMNEMKIVIPSTTGVECVEYVFQHCVEKHSRHFAPSNIPWGINVHVSVAECTVQL